MFSVVAGIPPENLSTTNLPTTNLAFSEKVVARPLGEQNPKTCQQLFGLCVACRQCPTDESGAGKLINNKPISKDCATDLIPASEDPETYQQEIYQQHSSN